LPPQAAKTFLHTPYQKKIPPPQAAKDFLRHFLYAIFQAIFLWVRAPAVQRA
jgi:hypothetical protein